ncbi:MAG: hypothetical protein CK425_01420 [Parachlamydia sp.]|nr:MAG: hypothetical protein CK425_01420 [Parachlamydia sp.]
MEEESNTSIPGILLNFPFIGSLEDGEPFQYLLLSIHPDFVEIGILDWFVNRVNLHQGAIVDLYIPKYLGKHEQRIDQTAGRVTLMTHSDEIHGEVFRVTYSHRQGEIDQKSWSFDAFIHQLQVPASLVDLCTTLLKDSMILKQGVLIYLKHLIAYFSRIVNYSHQEYAQLQEHFLRDIEKHIQANEAKLRALYQMTKEHLVKAEQIPVYIDLELLREALESEISSTLFHVVFSEHKELNPKETLLSQSTDAFSIYIRAIKNLEKRLYFNYNQIVVAYLKSMG